MTTYPAVQVSKCYKLQLLSIDVQEFSRTWQLL